MVRRLAVNRTPHCRWHTPHANEGDIDASSLRAVVESGQYVAPVEVVMFFTPECRGCRQMHPKVDRMVGKNPDIWFYHVCNPCACCSVCLFDSKPCHPSSTGSLVLQHHAVASFVSVAHSAVTLLCSMRASTACAAYSDRCAGCPAALPLLHALCSQQATRAGQRC